MNMDEKIPEHVFKILVMSCCYNEEHILPFYLDYYTNFIGADKIVIYDGGSTDKSQDIIKEYLNVDLIIDPQDKLDDRHLNDIRNDGWKPYRKDYDWIIVCDIDEFIYHPNLKEFLRKECDRKEITIPLTEGFDMTSKKFPKFEKGRYLPEIISRGVKDPVFLNKKSIFKSSIDINYHIGSHGCDPVGPVKYSETTEIKHLHYKWISHKYMTRRSAGVADRLSDWNLSGGCGSHNRPFSLTSINDFNKRYDFQSVQMIGEENKITPIYAFSHNYLINNWGEILNEQLNLLKNSILYEELTILFMYVYGDDDNFSKFNDIINEYDDLFRIKVIRIENNFYEYPTLQALQEFVKIENAYIFYFHLKGVWSVNSGGNPVAIRSWRKCLEYFNIERWRDCVAKLDEGYEVVGALYNYNEKEPLFSGNFWWSTTSYIKKLPKLEYVIDNDPDPNDPAKTWCRVECEKWINRIPNKFYNFYIPKDYGFYYVPLEERDYRDDKKNISILIQGPLNDISLSNLDYYKSIGPVIISYWDTDNEFLLKKYNLTDVGLVKNSYNKEFIRIFNNQNMYYQIYNTYYGLKEVKTEYVIKTRSDNKFEELAPFITKIYENSDKYICSNLHFRPPTIMPFHASDKLVGTKTILLLKAFEIAKYRCEFDQLLLMSGVYDETTYLGIDKKFKMWSADLKKPYTEMDEEPIIGVSKVLKNNHIGIVSEVLMATSFLMAKNIKPIKSEQIEQLYNNFYIVKVEDLKYTNKTFSSPEHNWEEIHNINEILDEKIFNDHYIEWRKNRINAIVNHYGKDWFKDKKILELGCGFADIGNSFYKLGAEVTVSDVRKEHLTVAKKRYPKLKIVHCDLDSEWVFNDHYDLILHTGVLYHLKNYKQNLIECFKHCDNIFLETEVVDSLEDIVIYEEQDNRYDQAYHGVGAKPSDKNLENIIKYNGFEFIRYFKSDLNSDSHSYDWVHKNDNNHRAGLRRAWFCKKSEKNYKISVLIPTYNRFNILKEAIQSVLEQNYDNIEILVCHDGPSDEYNKFKEENKHDKIFYSEVEKRNNYGAAQRNLMLDKVTGDYILHLDDDNIIYPDYFKKMIAQIDDKTGMVICRIHYNDKEWINYVLPREDRIQDCEIDQLGILFKTDIGKLFKWDDYFGHDHRYIKACEYAIKGRNLDIKYIPDILANHRFFGTIVPRIIIIHHCYLRYNWKTILEEQIQLMKKNGLYESCTEIFATIYADDKENCNKFREIINIEDNLKKWKIVELEQNNYEFDALKFLKKYSEDKHAYICYFHLKGVISEQIEPNIGVPTWRKYLNYFTITKWKDNVEHLKDNDVVCVDWSFNDMHQRYVLGGHFFWTKSEYIRTLGEPVNDENRFLSEIWITSNPNVKVHENFNYEKIGYKNLYLQIFPPSLYIREDRVKELLNERRMAHIEDDDIAPWFHVDGVTPTGVNRLFGLKDLITENINENSKICEIGSFIGKSSELLALYSGEVHCVDPWLLNDQVDDNAMISAEQKFDEVAKRYKNIHKIKNTSEGASHLFNFKTLDGIYIDGNHDYEYVKQDIILWTPKIKDSGFISGHDYHFEGVKRAVDELFNGIPVKIYSDYSWLVKIKDILYYGVYLNGFELKPVYVITSHPNYKMSEDITKRTLTNIKSFGEKTILSAHCPVSEELQNLTDYFVYDKNNPLIRHDFFTTSWFEESNYKATLNIIKNDNNFNHALGVFLNYYNSLIYAKSQGFNVAICTNFDMVFSKEDKKVIDERIERMISKGKQAFFMNTSEREGTHYKTIFFITKIDYFLNTFKYILDEKTYNEEMKKVNSNTNCLENFVYHTLKNKTNELLLEEINEDQLFPTSQINLFSLIEYNTILADENDSNAFIVWFSSANSLDNRLFNLEIKKNDQVIFNEDQLISKQFIYFKKVIFERGDNFELRFRTTSNGEVLRDKIIKVNNDIFADIKSYGTFIEKIPLKSI